MPLGAVSASAATVSTTASPRHFSIRHGLCRQHYILSVNQPHLPYHTNSLIQVISSIKSADKVNASSKRRRVELIRAVDSTQPSSAATSDKSIVSDDQFTLAKVSFGVIGLGAGITLLSYGFGAYFNILPGSEWSALMLTYGFPLAIIGMAFKYAELKPVPCITYSNAQTLREKCATDILKQVRSDVTRYRYGDEQHLDEALKRIFQYGQGGGIPRRSAPVLQMIREEKISGINWDKSLVTGDGKYSLVLVFEAKALQLSDFEQRQAKIASFFGPGITAEVGKGGDNLYEVRLISNTQP